jgi:RNA polymerase sigma-70 factor (ECF subfamily)
MSDYTPTELFVRHLSEHQSRLYACILSLLADPHAANDVLQDTNVVIWRKAAEYVEGTSFWAWVHRIAHFEVLAYRKRRQRDRHIFDDRLLASIAAEVARHGETMDSDLAALYRCMDKLSQLDQELVRGRYTPGGSVKRLADLWGKSAGAISQALYCIRAELAECIERERGTKTPSPSRPEER